MRADQCGACCVRRCANRLGTGDSQHFMRAFIGFFFLCAAANPTTSLRSAELITARSSPAPANTTIPNPATTGLLVIATLGGDRFRVEAARRTVMGFFTGWNCTVLVFHPYVMGSRSPAAKYLRGRCRVELRLGWGWASLLNLTTPEIVAGYDHIMIALDDIWLPPSFDTWAFVAEASRHNLSRASPGVYGATPASPSECINSTGPLACAATAQACGPDCGARLVPYIETFLVLNTRAAWVCYHVS